jgi:hypothetical protein
MASLARKPVESERGDSSSLTRLEMAGIQLCNERHYSVGEISKLWALSEKTVRRIFQDEPGVIQWGSEERLHKRGYRTFRIPESVLVRVHHKLRKAS